MKLYQFHGIESAHVDRQALKRAIEREALGDDPREIWREEGFFKDVDNRWKFEDNSGDGNELASDRWSLNPNYKELLDEGDVTLGELVNYPSLFKHAIYMLIYDVVYMSEPDDSVHGYFDHEAGLIAIHPDVINSGDINALKSLIDHEVAHGIQHTAGFSTGFSPEQHHKIALLKYIEGVKDRREQTVREWRRKHSDLLSDKREQEVNLKWAYFYKDYEKFVQYANVDKPLSVYKHIRQLCNVVHEAEFSDGSGHAHEAALLLEKWRLIPKSNNKGQREEALRDFCISGAQLVKGVMPQSIFRRFREADVGIDSILKSTSNRISGLRSKLKPLVELERRVEKLADYSDSIANKTSNEIYRLVGGEVAARAVEVRRNLTIQERRDTYPLDSYDVPLDDIIPLSSGQMVNLEDSRGYNHLDYRRVLAPASIEFGGKQFAKIILNPSADVSSLVHESAHYFLEIYSELNSYGGVKRQFTTDFHQILDWMGLTEAQWYELSDEHKEPYHEKFAEAFEHYILTNEAPKLAVFQQLKDFMATVYKRFRGEQLCDSKGIAHVFQELLSKRPVKPSSFTTEFVNIVNDEIDVKAGESIQLLHQTAFSYFSKMSGLTPSKLAKQFDLTLEVTKKELQTKVFNKV